MQGEFEKAKESDTDLDQNIVKLSELHELAYEDLILSINASSAVGNVAFEFLRNAKNLEIPEGNCKITRDRLVNKHALHTSLSLLKLRNEFHSSKLDSVAKDMNEWISNLEGYLI